MPEALASGALRNMREAAIPSASCIATARCAWQAKALPKRAQAKA